MRALHFNGTRAAVQEVPRPELNAESALVRVSLAGVCNTDLELVKGYLGFRGVLGHEFVGRRSRRVPRRSSASASSARSTSRAASCAACTLGLGRHCASRDVMGILRADGAFAELVRVPIANLHRVPAGVPDEIAVFAEPLAAAFEILEQVRVEPGRDCIVLGDGKLGLLVGAGAARGRRGRARGGATSGEARGAGAPWHPHASGLGRSARARVAGGRGDRLGARLRARRRRDCNRAARSC